MPVWLLRFLPYIVIGLVVLGAWLGWNHHWATFRELQASVVTLSEANKAQEAAISGLQQAQARTDEAMQRYAVASQDAARIARQARQSIAEVRQSKPVADYDAIPIPGDLRARLCGQFRCDENAGSDAEATGSPAGTPAAAELPAGADLGSGGLLARIRRLFAPSVHSNGQPEAVH